jgi:excisionase family DNA binding protein
MESITISIEQLESIVRKAVREELSEELLNTKETANILKVHYDTAKSLALRGEINYSVVGSSRRFKRSDIEAYIKSKQIKKAKSS